MNRALFQNPACCQYRVCSREVPLRVHEPCAEVPYRISRQWQMPTRGWWSPAASSFMPAKTGGFRQTMGDASHSRTEAFKTRTGLRDLAISQPETSSDFHSLASRPFSSPRCHACSCIGTKRTPHEANRPVRLPDSAVERRHAPFSFSSAANSFSRASRIAGTLPSVLPAMPKHFGSEPQARASPSFRTAFRAWQLPAPTGMDGGQATSASACARCASRPYAREGHLSPLPPEALPAPP